MPREGFQRLQENGSRLGGLRVRLRAYTNAPA